MDDDSLISAFVTLIFLVCIVRFGIWAAQSGYGFWAVVAIILLIAAIAGYANRDE